MKSTGIVRKIDQLGRFVLPSELRNLLNYNDGDQMEIFTDGDNIILRKYQCSCIFCKNTEDLEFFMGKPICSSCLDKLKK